MLLQDNFKINKSAYHFCKLGRQRKKHVEINDKKHLYITSSTWAFYPEVRVKIAKLIVTLTLSNHTFSTLLGNMKA